MPHTHTDTHSKIYWRANPCFKKVTFFCLPLHHPNSINLAESKFIERLHECSNKSFGGWRLRVARAPPVERLLTNLPVWTTLEAKGAEKTNVTYNRDFTRNGNESVRGWCRWKDFPSASTNAESSDLWQETQCLFVRRLHFLLLHSCLWLSDGQRHWRIASQATNQTAVSQGAFVLVHHDN